jgi:hypothetical protein
VAGFGSLLGDLVPCLQDLAQHLDLSGYEGLDDVMGGGGGSSPLPDAPKPLGELRVRHTI